MANNNDFLYSDYYQRSQNGFAGVGKNGKKKKKKNGFTGLDPRRIDDPGSSRWDLPTTQPTPKAFPVTLPGPVPTPLPTPTSPIEPGYHPGQFLDPRRIDDPPEWKAPGFSRWDIPVEEPPLWMGYDPFLDEDDLGGPIREPGGWGGDPRALESGLIRRYEEEGIDLTPEQAKEIILGGPKANYEEREELMTGVSVPTVEDIDAFRAGEARGASRWDVEEIGPSVTPAETAREVRAMAAMAAQAAPDAATTVEEPLRGPQAEAVRIAQRETAQGARATADAAQESLNFYIGLPAAFQQSVLAEHRERIDEGEEGLTVEDIVRERWPNLGQKALETTYEEAPALPEAPEGSENWTEEEWDNFYEAQAPEGQAALYTTTTPQDVVLGQVTPTPQVTPIKFGPDQFAAQDDEITIPGVGGQPSITATSSEPLNEEDFQAAMAAIQAGGDLGAIAPYIRLATTVLDGTEVEGGAIDPRSEILLDAWYRLNDPTGTAQRQFQKEQFDREQAGAENLVAIRMGFEGTQQEKALAVQRARDFAQTQNEADRLEFEGTQFTDEKERRDFQEYLAENEQRAQMGMDLIDVRTGELLPETEQPRKLIMERADIEQRQQRIQENLARSQMGMDLIDVETGEVLEDQPETMAERELQLADDRLTEEERSALIRESMDERGITVREEDLDEQERAALVREKLEERIQTERERATLVGETERARAARTGEAEQYRATRAAELERARAARTGEELTRRELDIRGTIAEATLSEAAVRERLGDEQNAIDRLRAEGTITAQDADRRQRQVEATAREDIERARLGLEETALEERERAARAGEARGLTAEQQIEQARLAREMQTGQRLTAEQQIEQARLEREMQTGGRLTAEQQIEQARLGREQQLGLETAGLTERERAARAGEARGLTAQQQIEQARLAREQQFGLETAGLTERERATRAAEELQQQQLVQQLGLETAGLTERERAARAGEAFRQQQLAQQAGLETAGLTERERAARAGEAFRQQQLAQQAGLETAGLTEQERAARAGEALQQQQLQQQATRGMTAQQQIEQARLEREMQTGQRMSAQQQIQQAGMERESESRRLLAQLSAQMMMQQSQQAMQNPYAFWAANQMMGAPGGAPPGMQQPFAQLGFQMPGGFAPEGAMGPGQFFGGGLPTLGALSQVGPEALQAILAPLGFAGTSPQQFGRRVRGITPQIAPRGFMGAMATRRPGARGFGALARA